MENMLKKIILADKTAQETVEKSEEQRRNVEEKIAEAKEKFEKKYDDETQIKIYELKEEKQKKLEIENKINSEKTEKQMKELDNVYAENKDKWVKSIVERVIGG